MLTVHDRFDLEEKSDGALLEYFAHAYSIYHYYLRVMNGSYLEYKERYLAARYEILKRMVMEK